jgi:hypothetical protein
MKAKLAQNYVKSEFPNYGAANMLSLITTAFDKGRILSGAANDKQNINVYVLKTMRPPPPPYIRAYSFTHVRKIKCAPLHYSVFRDVARASAV